LCRLCLLPHEIILTPEQRHVSPLFSLQPPFVFALTLTAGRINKTWSPYAYAIFTCKHLPTFSQRVRWGSLRIRWKFADKKNSLRIRWELAEKNHRWDSLKKNSLRFAENSLRIRWEFAENSLRVRWKENSLRERNQKNGSSDTAREKRNQKNGSSHTATKKRNQKNGSADNGRNKAPASGDKGGNNAFAYGENGENNAFAYGENGGNSALAFGENGRNNALAYGENGEIKALAYGENGGNNERTSGDSVSVTKPWRFIKMCLATRKRSSKRFRCF
jgi:hypothetical protein